MGKHKERGYKKASLFLIDNRQIDSIMIVKKLTCYNNNKNNKKYNKKIEYNAQKPLRFTKKCAKI